MWCEWWNIWLGVVSDSIDSKEDSTVENGNAAEKEINDKESKTMVEEHERKIDISLSIIIKM